MNQNETWKMMPLALICFFLTHYPQIELGFPGGMYNAICVGGNFVICVATKIFLNTDPRMYHMDHFARL